MATTGVEEHGSPFLPYWCEKMRTEYLLRPCDKNLARIKALRAKWPEAHIGPLEHCLACRGKDLVTREAPAGVRGIITGEVSIPIAEIGAGLQEALVPCNDILERIESAVRGPEKTRKLSPEKIAQGRAAVERLAKNRKPRGENASPEEDTMGKARLSVAEAEALVGAAKVAEILGTEKITVREPGTFLERDLKTVKKVFGAATKAALPADASQDPPMCLTHKLPIKFNKKGVSMGGCEVCRREIAAMGGHKAKIQMALNPLERIFADHPNELEWLGKEALEQLRTPERQLIYLCRVAMRQGGSPDEI